MTITVKPLREEAIKVGYEATKDRLPIDFGAWRKALSSWDVQAFCDGEKVVGMLMTQGPELHVAILPEARGKWLSRRLIREVFGPLLERYGAAKTKVAPGNRKGDDFVSRLGFEKMDGGYVKALRDGFASGAFDPVSAIATVAPVVGGLAQADASRHAANVQADAANSATAEQARQYDLARSDAAPYRAAGTDALGRLNTGLATGDMTRGFTSSDLANDPIYQKALQWATQQGTLAINRGAAARGGLDSGGTIKDITDYALNQAMLQGNDAFNRFNVTQGNQFNRNAALAGIGQTAVGQTNAAGANAANNISELMTGAGNARAAGIVGQSNAYTGALNNAANYYTGQQTLDKVLASGRGYNPYGAGGGTYNPYGSSGGSALSGFEQ